MPEIVWMTSTEAAEYIRIKPGSLRNMVSNKEIPFYKLKSGLRFKKSELDRLIEKSRYGGKFNGKRKV